MRARLGAGSCPAAGALPQVDRLRLDERRVGEAAVEGGAVDDHGVFEIVPERK